MIGRFITVLLLFGGVAATAPAQVPPRRQTAIGIAGSAFLINGKPTYEGRTHRGWKVEGLLMNARLVQGIFDDLNPATREKWNYPDGKWDAERNTREFIAAMPSWRAAGLLSFTINFQGGSPEGYSRAQPWHNSAFEPDGTLRPDYLARLEKILDRADELGMAPIVGLFYFGQAPHFHDEDAVLRAARNAIDWLTEKRYSHVLIEIANECDNAAYPAVLRPPRAHELIELTKRWSAGRAGAGGRLLVSTSFSGGKLPPANVAEHADFLLLHGNGVGSPDQIRKMVEQTRGLGSYRGQPILFNEDDHFDFEREDNNMIAALSRGAGWGYFDFRRPGEGFDEGFQSVPVNWKISSARKRGFFDLLAKVTGAARGP